MDAFVQAVESYVSRGATWFSDQFALKAVEMIAGTVEQAFSRRDSDSLERLLVGSFFAGIALSHARLGIVHGLAHPLGSRYHVPHGLACGVCLPSAIEFNRSAMGGKYGRLSEAAGGDLLGLTRRLLTALRIESPFAGRRLDDVAGIVAETLASGSTAANPRVVAAADVEALLRTLFAPA
jgi:alcohol dehydrogenase class IV